jgi:cytochrome c-type biogenesis protein CcmF
MGSNPFILLRDSGVLDNAPALHMNMDVTQALKPDYMQSIKDGNDLNPLLQNYWMVIHPPVLFMGFASTIVPFAFVIAGLWKKKFGEWTKPALPWALFSAAIFGVGIMMGAMWAYESLTFGGYWAWDPVENASLVPWLILISGIHTVLIYKHSGHSLRAAHLFFILSFGFVLYSTFLTRSGILGETSVHAFTDLGMNTQLYFFLFVFSWPFAFLVSSTIREKILIGVASITLLLSIGITGHFQISIHSVLISKILFFIGLGLIGYVIAKLFSPSTRFAWKSIVALVGFYLICKLFVRYFIPDELVNFLIAETVLFNKPLSPILSFITLLMGIILLIYQINKQVPTIQKEEEASSREFWMFIGALVFFLSAIVIIGKTT